MPLKPLLVREIKSFLKNPAFIASIIMIIVFYGALGQIVSRGIIESTREILEGRVGVVAEDDTLFVKTLILFLNESSRGKVAVYPSVREALGEANVVIVIPKGFTENITSGAAQAAIDVTISIRSLSPTTVQGALIFPSALASVLKDLIPIVYSSLYNVSIPLQVSVSARSSIFYEGKEFSEESIRVLTGFMYFLPLIMGIVLGMSAQYAAVMTAMEKAEKAFEMLLAQPIPRREIVAAKVLGSLVASVLTGVFYVIGFTLLISPISAGPAVNETIQPSLSPALNLTTFALIGVALVIGLIYSGSLGVIVGSLVNDERVAGILAAPITFLFIGMGLVTAMLGLPENIISGVLAGITITALPYIYIVSQLLGSWQLAAVGTASALCASSGLIALAFHIFERDIVVLGLRLRLRRVSSNR